MERCLACEAEGSLPQDHCLPSGAGRHPNQFGLAGEAALHGADRIALLQRK
jgi:hypothetical protein